MTKALQDTDDSHSPPLDALKWHQHGTARGRPTGGPPSALQVRAPPALRAHREAVHAHWRPRGSAGSLERAGAWLLGGGKLPVPVASTPVSSGYASPPLAKARTLGVALIVGRVCHFVGRVTWMDGLDTPSSLLEEKKSLNLHRGREGRPRRPQSQRRGQGKRTAPPSHTHSSPPLKNRPAQKIISLPTRRRPRCSRLLSRLSALQRCGRRRAGRGSGSGRAAVRGAAPCSRAPWRPMPAPTGTWWLPPLCWTSPPRRASATWARVSWSRTCCGLGAPRRTGYHRPRPTARQQLSPRALRSGHCPPARFRSSCAPRQNQSAPAGRSTARGGRFKCSAPRRTAPGCRAGLRRTETVPSSHQPQVSPLSPSQLRAALLGLWIPRPGRAGPSAQESARA